VDQICHHGLTLRASLLKIEDLFDPIQTHPDRDDDTGIPVESNAINHNTKAVKTREIPCP
jgi:hypothetical protein